MGKVYAVIYPVPQRFVNRFFEGKTVFVKYLPRRTKKLEIGMRLLLYVSGGPKAIIGEAFIETIEFMPLDEALQRYSDKIFLMKEELLTYSHRFGNRELKDLLLLHLTNTLEYARPVAYHRPVTMAGLYVDRRGYTSIASKGRG